jgi:hypothetical protein
LETVVWFDSEAPAKAGASRLYRRFANTAPVKISALWERISTGDEGQVTRP